MALCRLWLQSLKTYAAAFEGVPLAWPWYLPRPHKLFLLGFETAMWHVLGRPQKPQNLRSSFRRPQNLTTLRSGFRRRAACLAMVPPRPHKLFLLGFETAMWHVFGQASKASKPPQQLSKALEPHNPPQQLSKACRLLGHGTSLGPTSCFSWASKQPQNLRSSFRRPYNLTTPRSSFRRRAACLAMVPP